MSFDTLGLAPELLRAVAQQGYVAPTPVQRESIPLVLRGRDLLAGAQTGTGKTAAFVLPILQRLGLDKSAGPANGRRPVRVLVLAPTRELALQVEESVRTYSAQRPVGSVAIYGGVGFDAQARRLRQGPEIVVATPGRLLDHVGQRTIDLSRVEILVLDEADRMLDMGFMPDLRRILALLPSRRQNLLFSATLSTEIHRLAADFLHDPASVQVAPKATAAELVRQVVMPVDRERKRELLSTLIRSRRIEQALVFTRTKHGANRLAQQLERDGIATAAIHGNKSQPQRVRALEDLKRGRVAVLVATDIAARGLDIDSLPHVVNFELPMVAADYVHRIGRTGRAGADGDAISLVCIDERPLLREIERLLGHAIETEIVPGFEPDRSIGPKAIALRSTGPRPQGRPGGQRLATPAHRAGGTAPAAGNSLGARTRGDGAGRRAANGGSRSFARRDTYGSSIGQPPRQAMGEPHRPHDPRPHDPRPQSGRPQRGRPTVTLPGERRAGH